MELAYFWEHKYDQVDLIMMIWVAAIGTTETFSA